MMIFKCLIYFVCMMFSLALYADVSDKYVEKGAKVVGNSSVSTAVLYAEQWELARSGESLLSSPVLKNVLTAWLQDKSMIIEIRYPGGEEGELWVQELMDWLVSLGIPSNQMSTVPGSGADDVIKFALIK